jgi:transposase-like protein
MATGTENLSILAKHFSDESAARQLLEKMRWPNGVVCPHCGRDEPYKLTPKASGKNRVARRGLYKCRACRKQFSTTTGTIFESSHVPVSKWLLAIHLICASKKGLSAHQLHRMLGVTYRAAWVINHRLRHAMAQGEGVMFSGVVEADECYIGGRRRIGATNKADKEKLAIGRPGPKDKKLTPVVALVERKGRLALFPVERVNGKTLQDAIRRRVNLNAHMVTDDLNVYNGLEMGFASHRTINHSKKEYVKGDIHTNTVEGVFSLLKRGIIGTFHHVSKGHLHRYCDEFAFKYNTRTKLGYSDSDRAVALVAATEGKRLTYR